MSPTRATVIAAPLLLAVAELLSPIDTSDAPDERLADLLASSGRYQATVLCLVAGLLLLVPAVLALRATVPPSASRTATVGATIAAAGFMLFAVASGALGVGPTAWTSLPDADQQVLAPAFTAMDEGHGVMAVVLTAPLLPIVGLIILATVLGRTTAQPKAALVGLPLGWAVFLLAPNHLSRAAGALILAAGLLALGPTAFAAVHDPVTANA